MRKSLIVDLAECTEFRQTLQARPPRIVHGAALLLSALLVTAVVWAALTDADLVVRASGRIRPLETPHHVLNPARGDNLSASAGVRVMHVGFREGEEVKEGDVLVRFDTERIDNEITRQKDKIQAGEEELVRLGQEDKLLTRQFETGRAKATAELEQAQEEVRRAKERQSADLRLAQVELRAARDEESRLRRLVEQQAAAPAELVQSSSKRRVAEERLEKLRVPLEEGRVGVVRQALALVEKDYDLRREELAQKRAARQAEVKSARIEMANLELERKRGVLVAPRGGVVTKGDVKVGDILEPGKPVCEIAQSKGFRFEAVVAGEEVGHLKPGMPVRIKLDAFDYQKYGTLAGTVDFISPDSGVPEGKETVVYIVKVALEQDEIGRGENYGKIKLGMAGHAELVSGRESLLMLLLKRIRQSISLG